MANLHLIQNSLNLEEFNKNLSLYTSVGDSLLFLNDSVFSLAKLQPIMPQQHSIAENLKVYAITEQLDARGLACLAENMSLKTIDFKEFTELSLKSDKVISW